MRAWAARGWVMICLDFEGGEEGSEAIFSYRSSWDVCGHREDLKTHSMDILHCFIALSMGAACGRDRESGVIEASQSILERLGTSDGR